MTHPALDEDELYDEPESTDPMDRRSFLHDAVKQVYTPPQPPPEGSVAEIWDAVSPKELDRDRFIAPKPTGPKPKSDSYLTAVSAAMDILSYRVILLLSVLVAGGLFGLATWSPDPWRLGAAAAFSVIVVMPLTFFYARR